MLANYKEIHIGSMIEYAVMENRIESSRICNFFQCTEQEIEEWYRSATLDTGILLKWCKLLEYDFFRLYCQHLILYSPHSTTTKKNENQQKTNLPKFRKNIYTREVIDFILEQINTKEMTRKEVMERYKIPKGTLFKWISKYNHE